MLAMLQPVRSILWSVALLLLGNGLINTLLTLRGTDEGFSSTIVGVIMSAYFVGFTCGTWVSSRLIRRAGHIRTFAFCAALCASGALLHIIFVDPWVWIVLRFFYGLAFVTLMTVIESWLNGQAASHERGRVFATYMLVNLGAIAAAQQILRLDTPGGFLLFAVTAILISWALLPITMTRRQQPTVPENAKSSLKALIGFAPLSVTASVLSGLAMGAFWGMAPLYARQLGWSAGDVGTLMSVTILGGALLQLPIGRFSDKHDRSQVLTWVVIAAAALAALMPFAPNQVALLGLFFLWGGFSFAIYPLAVAQLIDQLHPEEVVSASADMLVTQGAGSALAPIVAGALMGVLGPQALPLYIAAVLAVLGAYALYRRRHVSDLVYGHPAHFEPMTQTSPLALEMIFDDSQPDLFDDPSFYEEQERQRLIEAYRQRE
ncbi:MFS transporter [Halomonas daqingensis]|uniref:MFS transporter n=1 Tax=Billgrantia desiderata TaxID=52021 RepID=UPI00174C1080|nr:MFS transporter [Halomonas desiderata]MCE8029212.1 MFS transporter [Halomonas desiderata]NIC36387.1 MFS transporter [Halomonas desiderata]